MSEITRNRWHSLRRFTSARIAPGRAGNALPTAANLQFQLDHARARDAVHRPLDRAALVEDLQPLGLPLINVHSRADNRAVYLQRPDLGRQLRDEDKATLQATTGDNDIAVVIVDGLSSTAVQQHAAPFLQILIPQLQDNGFGLFPLILVEQGRVAIGDDIGALLGSRLALVVIGERPGLSSPDSLGVYLTYDPRPGRADSDRNCISNIRPPEGQGYRQAADTCVYLCRNAMLKQLSGVKLKDDSVTLEQSRTEKIPFFRD